MRTLTFLNYILFVGLLAFGCAKEPLSNDHVLMGNWDIEGGGTLFFEGENFSASTGCNTLFGSVAVKGNTLTFSKIASTLIGCPETQGNREEELAALLDSATLTYKVDNNKAYLKNKEGQKILTLTRPVNMELVNVWELIYVRTENAVSSSILDEDTGITFKANGTLSVQTACNSGGGTYSVKDQVLTLNGLAFTERGCEEERMTREEEFTQALTQINSYSILRETLTLEKDGRVYLTFQLDE